jgi:dihydrofolate reductase
MRARPSRSRAGPRSRSSRTGSRARWSRQAQAAAGGKDVQIAGGANTIQEAFAAGLLDEIQIHFAPLLLGAGTRLFGDGEPSRLEPVRVIASPAVTHVQYRVLKDYS